MLSLFYFPIHIFTLFVLRFPGPGALTRALLTLPRDSFDKLIVLEEHPGYLDYLKVMFNSPAYIRSTSRLTMIDSDAPFALRSHWKR